MGRAHEDKHDIDGSHRYRARHTADFGFADLIEDTIELVDALEVERFVPVALSHAGWVAVEVRRRLGPDRVPAVVLLDWMPLGPPPGFMEALSGLQNPGVWR